MEKEEFTIKELYKTLKISRSGYYAHISEKKCQRQRADADLSIRIQDAFCQSRRTYGTRRLRILLVRERRFCSRRRISRLMKTNGLCAVRKGHFRPRTTDSRHNAGFFCSLLNSNGVTPSMSPRANCYDNASMESFWATLKTECFHAGIPSTRADADRLLFDYIETFYNPRRLHSALDYLSPTQYENSLKSSKPQNLIINSPN